MENLIQASGPSLAPNFYGLTQINEIPPQHRANCLLSEPKEKRAQCAQSVFFPIPGGAGGWICPFSPCDQQKRAQCALASNKCIILSHIFSFSAKDRGTLSSPNKSLQGQEENFYGKQSDKQLWIKPVGGHGPGAADRFQSG